MTGSRVGAVMADRRLAEAIEHHQAGRLPEAADLYQAVLRDSPDNIDALNLLGVIALSRGDADEAIGLIGKALAMRDDVADLHNNIGEAHRARGDLKQAISHYQHAISLEPNSADAHNNLGVALKATGSLEAAEAHFRRAIEAQPTHSRAHNNLGTVLRANGHSEAAVEHLVQAVELDPGYADAYSNLGNAMADLDRNDQARPLYARALELDPGHGEALINLGTALKHDGDTEASTAFYRQAIKRRPDFADAHFNLGVNLAETGDLDGARRAYLAAVQHAPEHIGANGNLARLELLMGRFAEGFDRWEWRWREPATWFRVLDHPVWAGQPLEDKTLLIWGEQGVGDEVMLASVLPDVTRLARRVIVECDARLIPLYQRSFPHAEFVAREEPASARLSSDEIDFQCALGSVCRWKRRSAETFANPAAYLSPDPTKVAQARARYAALGPGPKIGIAWRSKPVGVGLENAIFSAAKSTELADWEPILRCSGVDFINLQYGDCAAELLAVRDKFGVEIHQDAVVDQLVSLDDFAAQIAALDLVIAASNTTVHLAGALGAPTWTMIPFVPDWRWQMARDDTLWYPDMRLFRQPATGDWRSVFDRVGAELSRVYAEPEKVL